MHAKRIISKPRITVSNHGMDVFIVFYTNNSLCNIFSDYVFFLNHTKTISLKQFVIIYMFVKCVMISYL